jgi:hypothetical protein
VVGAAKEEIIANLEKHKTVVAAAWFAFLSYLFC